MEELVSIIMPCHNGIKYIEASIKSVIEQTYKNWELLIINDNSTDESVKIILDYIKKDSRIKLLSTDRSTGSPATPRNVGIKAAQGRYIAFLDCDDLWLPTKLENQLSLFSPNVPIVFSWYEKIDENGKRTNRIIKSKTGITYKKLLKTDCIGNLTGIYDVNLVEKIYQPEIPMEDYIMWLNVLKPGGIAVNTNTVEALYRVGKKSVSSDKFNHLQWQWNVYRKSFKLNFFYSCYLYMCYAFFGFLKYLK